MESSQTVSIFFKISQFYVSFTFKFCGPTTCVGFYRTITRFSRNPSVIYGHARHIEVLEGGEAAAAAVNAPRSGVLIIKKIFICCLTNVGARTQTLGACAFVCIKLLRGPSRLTTKTRRVNSSLSVMTPRVPCGYTFTRGIGGGGGGT